MPRTHRAMIAKKLAETTGLNYAAALQRVTAAQISGTITGPYDKLAIAHAAATLAGEYRTETTRAAIDLTEDETSFDHQAAPIPGSLLDLVARHRRVVIQAPHNTGGTTVISALHTMSRAADMPSFWVYADEARAGTSFPLFHAPTVFVTDPIEPGMLQMLTMQFTGMRDFTAETGQSVGVWNDRIVFVDTPDIDPFEDPEHTGPSQTSVRDDIWSLLRAVWCDAKYPATLVYLTRTESSLLFAGDRTAFGVEADSSMAAASDLLLRPIPPEGPDGLWSVVWASALPEAKRGGFDMAGTLPLQWTEELHGRPAPAWHPSQAQPSRLVGTRWRNPTGGTYRVSLVRDQVAVLAHLDGPAGPEGLGGTTAAALDELLTWTERTDIEVR